MENMQNICTCKHSEEMHKGLWFIPSGEVPRSSKDTHCSADRCECKEYIFLRRECAYCLKEIKNDGPYAKRITDENPVGGSQEAPDYCLTVDCPNFKYKQS